MYKCKLHEHAKLSSLNPKIKKIELSDISILFLFLVNLPVSLAHSTFQM